MSALAEVDRVHHQFAGYSCPRDLWVCPQCGSAAQNPTGQPLLVLTVGLATTTNTRRGVEPTRSTVTWWPLVSVVIVGTD